MFGLNSITISSTQVAAVAVACVGFAAFWANPQRLMNRAFLTGSLHVCAWLATLQSAFTSENGLFWLRLGCSIGALLPIHIWIIQRILAAQIERRFSDWARTNWAWIAASAFLAVIPFTEVFIPSHSSAEHRIRGWGFYTYTVLDIGLFVLLFRHAYKGVKTLAGARRLELQLWLSAGCIIAAAVLTLMVLNGVTKNPNFIRIQPVIILLFYAGTAYAITTYRILDARQIVLLCLEKSVLIVAVAGLAYALDFVLSGVMPHPFDFFATTALALWFAVTFNGWLDKKFHFYPEATVARQAAFTAAQRETKVEDLQTSFLAVLKGWGGSERALILSGGKGLLTGAGIELRDDDIVVRTMRRLRWATPERLMRERSTLERSSVAKFIEQHEIGLLTIGEGPALTALVGVGTSASRRPFTYPQAAQLLELTSIMQGALERAHFSTKVQHTEQLATVGLLGASLAHEIRNPLVSIKTFVQLLPTHHQDPAFREKFFRLIGDEVGRIDQLTEQLLDLASPRTYTANIIELHPILRASLDLVAAKAAHRSVQFLTDFRASPDRAFTDASAAKQVMLNLCFNALQAVEQRESAERWVRVGTRNTAAGIEMAVADSGPGISEEIRPRLFQPFQTTKSTGFGLGLAICSDILANLNASITVDPPTPGAGATFRVTFPCRPLSS
jgi:signal transduction histidine kinase